MQTRTYAAHGPDKPLVPFTLARRPLGERDVHVAIDYCGIVSDIELIAPEQINTAWSCLICGIGPLALHRGYR